jgi:dTDP-4-dehydrorhamnose 3,5-epimerase
LIEEVSFESGGVAVDDRGSLKFVNTMDLSPFKRFYIVENHEKGFIRAWHGHKREGKAVVCVKGSAIVAAVKVDDWDSPSKDLPVNRFVLSEARFGALHIPPGFANGFKTLSSDAVLMFLSTSSLEESGGDDIRFEARYWNPWQVEER